MQEEIRWLNLCKRTRNDITKKILNEYIEKGSVVFWLLKKHLKKIIKYHQKLLIKIPKKQEIFSKREDLGNIYNAYNVNKIDYVN